LDLTLDDNNGWLSADAIDRASGGPVEVEKGGL
jgi:hypothetical protein